MRDTFPSNSSNGFTLTEVMIVAAIIAIIAAIALPSYQDSVSKTRRSDGQALLLEAAQIQERHFTQFGGYGTTIAASGTPDASTVIINTTSENGYYTLTGALSTTTFTLTAAPAGAQTGDECGSLTLTHTGIKGKSGTADLADCW